MIYYPHMRLSAKEMNEYISAGSAVDASDGGLLLRSYEEGGIYFWNKHNDYYLLEGRSEGYEFVFNLGATDYFKEIIIKLLKSDEQTTLHFENYPVGSHIKQIDTTHLNEPKFIFFDDQDQSLIINKFAVYRYLITLNLMNKAVSYKRNGPEFYTIIKDAFPIPVLNFNEVESIIQFPHENLREFAIPILKIKNEMSKN